MKQLIFFFIQILSICLFPYNAESQAKKNFPFHKVEGFRPRLNAFTGTGLTVEMFSGKDAFLNIFEKSSGHKTSSGPDYSRETLIACFGNKTTTETMVSLEKIEGSGGVLRVYFKAVYGKKLARPMVPYAVYRFVHDPSLSGIDYYINGKLFQELRN
jgi:hypothetical protein